MNAKIIKHEVQGPYPKSGNFGTQAKTFRWSLVVDGKVILPYQGKKRDCVEVAKQMGITSALPIETVLRSVVS